MKSKGGGFKPKIPQYKIEQLFVNKKFMCVFIDKTENF